MTVKNKILKFKVLLLIPIAIILFGFKEFNAVVILDQLAVKPILKDSIRLFNGKDLNNWKLITNDTLFTGDAEDIFAIENEVLHVYSHQQPFSKQTFAGLYTDKSYGNYRLTLEYKWGEKKFRPRHESVRDAGVLFHVIREDVFWPYGVECQIQEGDTGDLWIIGTKASTRVQKGEFTYSPNGELATKGSLNEKYNRFHRSYSWEIPGWNRIEIEVIEDHAKFRINGHLVNEAIDMNIITGSFSNSSILPSASHSY